MALDTKQAWSKSWWFLDIMKWFKIWRIKYLLELSSGAMKYVIIEIRLQVALSMKWQVAKMSKFESCIANVGPKTR